MSPSPAPQSRVVFAPVVMAGLALASLALLGLSDFTRSGSTMEAAAKDDSSSASTTAEDLAQDPEVALVLSDSTKDLVLECTRGINSLRGVSNRLDFTTLDEYLQKIVSNPQDHAQKTYLVSRQIDVLEAGRHLRLSLKPETNSKARAVALTGELAELQWGHKPRLLSRISGAQTSEHAIGAFRSRGQVLADESTEIRRWDEAVGARIVRRNGQIQKLRVFFQDGVLNCAPDQHHAISCGCLR